MTDRYDHISSLFLEAIGLIPAPFMEEIRDKGVKTELVPSKAAPGVFFTRSYSQRLTNQYGGADQNPGITEELYDEYNQKVEFAISETLRLFTEFPSKEQFKEWDAVFPIRVDFDNLKGIDPAIIPETVMREVARLPILFQSANSKAFSEFTKRFTEVLRICEWDREAV